jgi:hypothetical protein
MKDYPQNQLQQQFMTCDYIDPTGPAIETKHPRLGESLHLTIKKTGGEFKTSLGQQ